MLMKKIFVIMFDWHSMKPIWNEHCGLLQTGKTMLPPEREINLCNDDIFWENMRVYLHFTWFVNTGACQVHPQWWKECPHRTESISLLLMTWRRKEPGHHQPWYWPNMPRILPYQHQKIQYNCCWWPGDPRSQGISSYDINPICPEYSLISTRRFNTIAVDDLAMQGARASAAMISTQFAQNIPLSAPEDSI